MTRQQIVALFVCSLVVWIEGNGLLPILPKYAKLLGADTALIGYYLAIVYSALALGTVTAGWISDRLGQRRLPLIAAGVVGIPLLWLMSSVTGLLELIILTSSIWFIGGLILTLTSILTGLFSEKGKRGRIFGLLTGTSALGALVGGLMIGPIADQWGFEILFVVLALLWIAQPVSGLFLQDIGTAQRKLVDEGSSSQSSLGIPITLFLISYTMAETALFVGRLGTSLSMNRLGFDSAAITSTAAAGGLIALPLPFLLGTLSDRVGRRRLLTSCYLAAVSGLLVLVAAGALWNFWLAAILLSVFAYATAGVGSAFVMDLVSPQSVSRGLSFLNTTGWVGAVIGLAATGYMFQNLGFSLTFIFGSLLPLAGIGLLALTRRSKQESLSWGEIFDES